MWFTPALEERSVMAQKTHKVIQSAQMGRKQVCCILQVYEDIWVVFIEGKKREGKE